ncbi:PAS domain S-box-containing protein, partial [Syntrophus gentianae]
MHDPSRTNQELLEENYALKQKIKELEQSDAEYKQVERALRNSEERLRGIAEAMNQLVWIVGADGSSIYHNPRFVEYTGLKGVTAEEIWQIIHPEDRLQLQRRWQEMIRSGSVYQSPCRLRSSVNGNYRWFLIQGSVLRDYDGKAAQCLCIATDIDDFKQAEEALRKSEANYRLLHKSMRDAFARVDLDGTIREFNDAYVEMLGYTSEELKMMNFRDITPEKWHALEAEIIEKQVIPRGYSDVYEKEYRRKDGTVLPVELRTSLLRDYAGKPSAMWAIIRDIGERKKAEDTLRATFKAAPVGLSLMKGRVFQSVNQAWCDITGYSEAEIIGHTTRTLYENEAEYERVR